MPARSTRWIAVVLAVAVAAVVWLALRDDARGSVGTPAAEAPGRGGDPRSADADAVELQAPATHPIASSVEPAREPVASDPGLVVPGPRELGLTFVDPRDAPVQGASWVAFRGATVVARGVTAGDGVAPVVIEAALEATADRRSGDLPDAAAALELAVTCAGFHPLRTALALEPAEQTIVLGAGAAISGVVRIDGAPPAEPFGLWLFADAPFWATDALPAPVAEALFGRVRAESSISATAGADGAFRFEGLEAGWSGRLGWAQCPLANPPPSADPLAPPADMQVDVTAPRDGLVLELLSPLELVGRVVDPQTGEPVPSPFVRAAWSMPGSASSSAGTHQADGAFRFRFVRELPERVQLEVGDGAGTALKAYDVEIPRGVRRWDTGPLAIARARAFAFRVTGVTGEPIADASVAGVAGASDASDVSGRADLSGGWEPARSDAAGLGTIAVPADATGLRALALGFEPAVVALPAALPADERVDIVLRPAATLELVLSGNARALGVMLSFGAEEPFVADGAPSWVPEIAPKHGGSKLRFGAGGSLFYAGAADGRYVLGGVRPGVALQVAAADDYANRIAERAVAPLAPGERRVVELVVERDLLTLAGRVVDTAGAPVSRASVMLSSVAGKGYRGERVDEQGRFRFENLAADRVTAVVEADGFPAKRFPALRVDDAPVELVLETGREIRIVVVGAQGEPLSDLGIDPSRDGDAWWNAEPVEEQPGTYVVRDAPSGPIDFTVWVGGRMLPGRVEADSDSARVVVGAMQACTVALAQAFASRPGEQATAVLVPVDEGPGGALGIGAGMTLPLAHGAREVRFEQVLPGRFVAYVQAFGKNGRTRLCDPVEVVVTADAPARVELVLREP